MMIKIIYLQKKLANLEMQLGEYNKTYKKDIKNMINKFKQKENNYNKKVVDLENKITSLKKKERYIIKVITKISRFILIQNNIDSLKDVEKALNKAKRLNMIDDSRILISNNERG